MYVIVYTLLYTKVLNICHNKKFKYKSIQESWFFQYVIIFLQVNF